MEISTIEALQNSDHKAFEEMFLAYFDKVKYLLTGLLRSESDAEELGISKKTVENQLSLALQEIKRVISAFLIFFF